MTTAPLTAHARVRMQQPQAFKRLEPYLGAYAIVAADDAVVTVGHRAGRWRG